MLKNEEAELIARCCQGDAAAWDTLFDRHYAATGRFIFQLAPDFSREDVEEICQETFLTVIKNLKSFHGRSQFQTWLFRIAANKARDYRERQHAAKRGGGQVILSLHAQEQEDNSPIDPPSSHPAPDTALLKTEQCELVYEALRQLGPPCQEIIEMHYFGDLSYDQIGHTLQLNPKTVSSRLSRCLHRLGELARRLFATPSAPSPSVQKDPKTSVPTASQASPAFSGEKPAPFPSNHYAA